MDSLEERMKELEALVLKQNETITTMVRGLESVEATLVHLTGGLAGLKMIAVRLVALEARMDTKRSFWRGGNG